MGPLCSWFILATASFLVQAVKPSIKSSQTCALAPAISLSMIKATRRLSGHTSPKPRGQVHHADATTTHRLYPQSGSNAKKTPSVTTSLLHKDTDGPEMTPDFHYRSVIGKLNFLKKIHTPQYLHQQAPVRALLKEPEMESC